MTPAAVPVAAAVIMAVPNYNWTRHDFIEGQAEASFWVAFIFSKKNTNKKYKQINRKFSKMEMMNKCHFLVPFHIKKKIPAKPHPLVHLKERGRGSIHAYFPKKNKVNIACGTTYSFSPYSLSLPVRRPPASIYYTPACPSARLPAQSQPFSATKKNRTKWVWLHYLCDPLLL